MDRVDSLKIFAQIADLGSFTRAAAVLQVPKATVSTVVQRLEQELGARLFHRTTRVVRLTHEGELLYARCRTLIADFDELSGLFRKAPGELSGRVRIDMSSSLARHFFIPRLPSFLSAHPHIEVEVSATDRVAESARDGVDLVIRAGTLADSPLTARPIGKMTQLNAVSADYLRRRGWPKTPDDLDGHTVVGYAEAGDPDPASFEWLEGTTTRARPVKCHMTVTNADSYAEACLAGLGIIQAPAYLLQRYFSSGALVEVLLAYRAPALPLSVLHPPRRQLSRRARALLEFIEPELRATVCR